MTRRMTPAPTNVTVTKTSRGTWIAFREIWKGDRLVDIHPMREVSGARELQVIMQKSERRLMLLEIERALLATQLEEARREIAELKSPSSAPTRAG